MAGLASRAVSAGGINQASHQATQHPMCKPASRHGTAGCHLRQATPPTTNPDPASESAASRQRATFQSSQSNQQAAVKVATGTGHPAKQGSEPRVRPQPTVCPWGASGAGLPPSCHRMPPANGHAVSHAHRASHWQTQSHRYSLALIHSVVHTHAHLQTPPCSTAPPLSLPTGAPLSRLHKWVATKMAGLIPHQMTTKWGGKQSTYPYPRFPPKYWAAHRGGL